MSEYINNVSQRKETIKNVLKQLHQGKTIEEVKAEFGALANEVSYLEIAEIEQMLIQDGMPIDEIQSLCDVHVAFFKDTLDDQRPPETLSGHPVHTFRAENEKLIEMLDQMEPVARQIEEGELSGLDMIASNLQVVQQIDRHYLRKENLLFPHLEKYGFTGPSKVMWGVQDEIRAQIKNLLTQIRTSPLTIAASFKDLYGKLETALREMVYKEEKILLPAALERLTVDEWIMIRSQENQFGFFRYTPG